MSKSLLFLLFFSLLGCFHSGSVVQADDGIPSDAKMSIFTGEHKKLNKKQLSEWGLDAYFSAVLEDEYILHLTFSESLVKSLSLGGSEIYFSLFDKSNELVLSFPSSKDKNASFSILKGYKIRAMLVSKEEFNAFKAGVGYYFDFDTGSK